MKYSYYLNNWIFFSTKFLVRKKNFLRNRISRVDCFFLSISPFSVKDRWNEVFREELLLLFFFRFQIYMESIFLPNWGNSRSSFIIRLSQKQIKMTFKFHSIMAMTLLYIPPVYIVDHYYIVLSLRIFTNIRNILCNLFSVVNLNDEISFRFRKTSFKKVEKKRIFPQTGIRCLFTNFSTIYSHYLL